MFWKTMLGTVVGMIVARNVIPVIDYGSRKLAIRLLRAMEK